MYPGCRSRRRRRCPRTAGPGCRGRVAVRARHRERAAQDVERGRRLRPGARGVEQGPLPGHVTVGRRRHRFRPVVEAGSRRCSRVDSTTWSGTPSTVPYDASNFLVPACRAVAARARLRLPVGHLQQATQRVAGTRDPVMLHGGTVLRVHPVRQEPAVVRKVRRGIGASDRAQSDGEDLLHRPSAPPSP